MANGRNRLYSEILLFVIALIAFSPFLGLGFGLNDVAYRIIGAGKDLLDTGVYHPSRGFGYPLAEMSIGILGAHAGPIAANTIVAIFAACAVVMLYRLLREADCLQPWIIALGFALSPLVIQVSTESMDYMPSLAMGLAALHFRKRPVLAGLLLGICVGFRPTGVLFAIPLGLLIIREENWRWATVTLGIGAVISMVLYAPIILGMIGSPLAPSLPGFEWSHIPYYLFYMFGPVAYLVIIIGVILGHRQPESNKWFRISILIGACVMTMLFVWKPLAMPYLLPVMALGIIFIAPYFKRGWCAAFGISLIVLSLVSIEVKEIEKPDENIVFHPHFSIGRTIVYYLDRKETIEVANFIRENPDKLSKGKMVIFAGSQLAGPLFLEPFEMGKLDIEGTQLHILKTEPNILLGRAPNESAINELKKRDYELVFLENAVRITWVMHQYNPMEIDDVEYYSHKDFREELNF